MLHNLGQSLWLDNITRDLLMALGSKLDEREWPRLEDVFVRAVPFIACDPACPTVHIVAQQLVRRIRHCLQRKATLVVEMIL